MGTCPTHSRPHPTRRQSTIDSGLSRSLRRRNTYSRLNRLVVSRCLILHKHWCWWLDDDASSALFRHLVDIAGSAAFVQESAARLLIEDATTDSTFTIFLKLIFAFAEQMGPTLREDKYLGRTKKLLPLVTPVGSVQLSALRSLFDE
jgi:hypothetical protein